jgi:hypothetical protein
LGELYRELMDLEAVFDQVEFDLRKNTIAVVTPPITLEDIFLGPFEIRLRLGTGGQRPAYSVLALEPTPASANRDVTHPHVQRERLCEGDGRAPIRLALEQGRLVDFFQIVTQVLQTYNPGSAYVSLDNWFGGTCADCGRSSDDDGSYACEHCDSSLCGDCQRSCEGCLTGYCTQCIGYCEACEQDYCAGCRTECNTCGVSCCARCLEEKLCPQCRPERSTAAEEEPPAPVGVLTCPNPLVSLRSHT